MTMRVSIVIGIAALLASGPAFAQSASDPADATAATSTAAKPKMKRVCKVKDSGNPMHPDRICHMVPVTSEPVAQAAEAAAPRTDQMAQNTQAPQL
jgi:hypothetical protein